MSTPRAFIHFSNANVQSIRDITPNERALGLSLLAHDAETGLAWWFDPTGTGDASAVLLVPTLGDGRWKPLTTLVGTANVAAIAQLILDLASVSTGFGASLIGVDATNNTLEAALAAIKTTADAGHTNAPAWQVVAAGALVSGTLAITTGITVAANSEIIPILTGAITGSTNFGSLRELKSSRVNGAPSTGAVTIEAVGADGAKDADAAAGSGVIRVIILTPQA